MHVGSLGQENPWRRKWQPILVFLPGKSHGERSLAGYRPWGLAQRTAERLSLFTAIITVRVTIPVITTVVLLVTLTLCHEMRETFTYIISFNLYNGPFG